ncbi:hypothetical protein DFQ28_011554 [Apophysomyces sp. BC1034]|nr:hypothetical protein DFQ29_000370 [Apophysomyces sp. BC1021]KAG0184229.1 hypothetical protein DFQ28_011554 [Apophysomyces sp. BC1034]
MSRYASEEMADIWEKEIEEKQQQPNESVEDVGFPIRADIAYEIAKEGKPKYFDRAIERARHFETVQRKFGKQVQEVSDTTLTETSLNKMSGSTSEKQYGGSTPDNASVTSESVVSAVSELMREFRALKSSQQQQFTGATSPWSQLLRVRTARPQVVPVRAAATAAEGNTSAG